MSKLKPLYSQAESHNYGQVVCCDGCNGPYGSNVNGGALIGSYAMCGECCNKYGYDKPDYKYKDEVDELWDKDKTFKENVLDYRTKTYGTPDLITTFIPLSNK